MPRMVFEVPLRLTASTRSREQGDQQEQQDRQGVCEACLGAQIMPGSIPCHTARSHRASPSELTGHPNDGSRPLHA